MWQRCPDQKEIEDVFVKINVTSPPVYGKFGDVMYLRGSIIDGVYEGLIVNVKKHVDARDDGPIDPYSGKLVRYFSGMLRSYHEATFSGVASYELIVRQEYDE